MKASGTIAVVVMFCAGVLACSSAPEAAELVGTYAFSIAADTLHLEPSGQYRRVFVRDDTGAGPRAP